MSLSKSFDDYHPSLLRIGLSLVFLYFGIKQLLNPAPFIGWLPKEVALIPISPLSFVIINGAVEVFFGILLLLGIFRRTSALILALHLFAIAYSMGFTEIGVRDVGLAISTLVIVFIRDDLFSLDKYLKTQDD